MLGSEGSRVRHHGAQLKPSMGVLGLEQVEQDCRRLADVTRMDGGCINFLCASLALQECTERRVFDLPSNALTMRPI